MSFSFPRLLGFAVGSVIFTLVLLLCAPEIAYSPRPDRPVLLVVVACEVLGVVAVGLAGTRLVWVLAGLWTATVLLMIYGGIEWSGPFGPIPPGLVYGSLVFAVWAFMGAAAWRLMRRRGPAATDAKLEP